ncbi:acyl-CoA dehydrogenase [Algoriphagus sp. H41]|uniref:Acyl-CoA dehydrogenase n=1 Tax=Algoriphagus oliviformis TaxID=2811231 RepID=A0ABS3C5E0_9BACT|nr:acyl-CoA dehydrogenase [Algoriphagus oliviformis]MBN7812208.1 acyl-CoA dehydrogenase [Algoriphagus oliviformis]
MKHSKLFDSAHAAASEALGRLSDEWLEVVYAEKWFKLFVPKDLGGLGLNLAEGLRVEEKLSRLDGSLGWTVTLCAGAAWFVGFLEKELAQEVFSDPRVCLAGSGFVGGKADWVDGRWLVSGSWTYASGALHGTHFTANCEILERGEPLLDKKGNPVVKAFILKRDEIEILDGWNYMGMIATGSHAFKAEGVSVPGNRVFEILPEKATLPDPVFRYPFLQLAEATLAVNILGISQHLIALIEASFWKRHEYRNYDRKHQKYFQKLLEKQSRKLERLRTKFYGLIEESCQELEQKGKISKSLLKEISKISRKLTQACRESNGKLYPFAGLEAAKTHTELNRVWRDFNTVSQHALLIFPF